MKYMFPPIGFKIKDSNIRILFGLQNFRIESEYSRFEGKDSNPNLNMNNLFIFEKKMTNVILKKGQIKNII